MKKIKEDRILINDYSSMTDLKEEIRKVIKTRKDSSWSFCCMENTGSVISLKFSFH